MPCGESMLLFPHFLSFYSFFLPLHFEVPFAQLSLWLLVLWKVGAMLYSPSDFFFFCTSDHTEAYIILHGRCLVAPHPCLFLCFRLGKERQREKKEKHFAVSCTLFGKSTSFSLQLAYALCDKLIIIGTSIKLTTIERVWGTWVSCFDLSCYIYSWWTFEWVLSRE